MKKTITLLFLFSVLLSSGQDAVKLLETGRKFIQQGDYSNAKLVLNRAMQLNPQDFNIRKELAYAAYLTSDLDEALELINSVLETDAADDQSYQIAGNVYKTKGMVREAELIFRKGLKKFPKSGALLYETGESLLLQKQPAEAIKFWEQGIENDPGFAGNYYHAAKYYFFSKTNPVLQVIYGEIFINTDPNTPKSVEMKEILLESYKQMFTEKFSFQGPNPNAFQKAVFTTFMKQQDLVLSGIQAETLVMLRTRFLLDWFNTYATTFPHILLERLRNLAALGLFEAYNQWLFGQVANEAVYQHWINNNLKKTGEFSNFLRNNPFQMIGGQYYK